MNKSPLVLILAVSSALHAAEQGSPVSLHPAQEQGAAIVKRLDTMVVTATRTEQELRNIGSAMTVITAQDIAHRQLYTVADLLRTVPGVDVVQNGGIGRTTSVFIRGATSGQTLVLLNGIEMNDPSSPSSGFDFADLTVDDIERIEILRGPQSTLYGSDAIGGVINIITKKGQGKPRFSLLGEGGSYDSYKVGGSFSGASELLNYDLSVNHLRTRGFSAADEDLSGNTEKDGYKNTTVNTSLGVTPLENFKIQWNLRYSDADKQLDNCGGPFCDNTFRENNTQQLYTGLNGELSLFEGLWEQQLSVAYTNSNRQDHDQSPGAFIPFSEFDGNKIKVNWQHDIHFVDFNTLTLGFADEEEWMSTDSISRKSQNTAGYYLQDQLNLWDRSYTTAGVRYDDNNRFGGKTTWRVTQLFAIDEVGTRIKGSYGTGFKTPSLFQLFAPADPFFGPIGNPDLKPETSRGWDVGFTQTLWDDQVLFGASYFNNHFDDLIGFSTGFNNIDRASSKGVESYIEINPLPGLTLRGNYTFSKSRDDTTGLLRLRLPRNKGSVNINYNFLEHANINLNVLVVGDRVDMDFSSFPFRHVTVPGYTVVNLAGSYEVNQYMKTYVRIDNLFNKQYQEVFGFGTSGIAAFGGIRVSYQ